MEFSNDELESVPIGIHLSELDLMYWRVRSLRKIGSLVSKSLMVDRNTDKKVGLNFAWLLVDVDIGATFPNEVYFKNKKGVVID